MQFALYLIQLSMFNFIKRFYRLILPEISPCILAAVSSPVRYLKTKIFDLSYLGY
jgi:hypothetical protein